MFTSPKKSTQQPAFPRGTTPMVRKNEKEQTFLFVSIQFSSSGVAVSKGVVKAHTDKMTAQNFLRGLWHR